MARWCLHVDNPDEIAGWNRALIELMRKLAKREAEATQAGKPFSHRPYDIVSDIDRYLAKNRFVTTRQLATLMDIAKQNQVDLPQIPPK